jgi:hypothetical protein
MKDIAGTLVNVTAGILLVVTLVFAFILASDEMKVSFGNAKAACDWKLGVDNYTMIQENVVPVPNTQDYLTCVQYNTGKVWIPGRMVE